MREPGSLATARVIAGQLRLAAGYLDDAAILAQHDSRNAANMLFLAAEAALIAVLTAEGLEAGRANQHQLAAMSDKLPAASALKSSFGAIEHLTAYATTFRYVTPAGRIKDGPGKDELLSLHGKVDVIIQRCRDWFGVDLDIRAQTSAARSSPPRDS